jgi:hypothetical protein
MKDIGWLLLGGGVLYVMYEMGFFGTATAAPATTTTTSTSPQANQSTSVTSPSTTATTNNNSTPSPALVPAPGGTGTVASPTTLAGLQAYVHAWALTDPNFVMMASGQYAGQLMADPYKWNFYVNYGAPQTTGNPINTTMFAGTNAATSLSSAVTESQFWAAVGPTLSSYGLSGLGGLGLIANRVNPYLQGPRVGRSQIYGSNLAPTGPETMIVVRSNG